MREIDKVSGTFFSKSPAGDTMGKCTVSIQRVPALDAIAKKTHLPMPQRQLPDTADTDRDHNRVATRAATASIRGKGMD